MLGRQVANRPEEVDPRIRPAVAVPDLLIKKDTKSVSERRHVDEIRDRNNRSRQKIASFPKTHPGPLLAPSCANIPTVGLLRSPAPSVCSSSPPEPLSVSNRAITIIRSKQESYERLDGFFERIFDENSLNVAKVN